MSRLSNMTDNLHLQMLDIPCGYRRRIFYIDGEDLSVRRRLAESESVENSSFLNALQFLLLLLLTTF